MEILREQYGLNKMVTYTSRAMRPGEIEGVDYFFLSKEEFEEILYVTNLINCHMRPLTLWQRTLPNQKKSSLSF